MQLHPDIKQIIDDNCLNVTHLENGDAVYQFTEKHIYSLLGVILDKPSTNKRKLYDATDKALNALKTESLRRQFTLPLDNDTIKK